MAQTRFEEEHRVATHADKKIYSLGRNDKAKNYSSTYTHTHTHVPANNAVALGSERCLFEPRRSDSGVK